MAHYWTYIEILWQPGMFESKRSNGQVLEHREVAAQTLLRALKPGEVVHHKDEDKRNNDPSNLMVFSSSADHQRHHAGGELVPNGDGTYRCVTKVVLCECGNSRTPSALECLECYKQNKASRIPDRDVLARLVWEKPTSSLARDLGVSDVAIAKWCRKLDIDKPPRGYWAKQRAKL